MAACDEVLPGVGDSSGESETYFDCGTPYLTDDITSMESMPHETISHDIETDVDVYVCVDWMDFVKVDGETYNGGFENRTVDESLIGEKIGEIAYKVGSSSYTSTELEEVAKIDFSSYLRDVGCEIFKVKNVEGAVAVLEDGKYYLYTKSIYRVSFNVFGGEMYSWPASNDRNLAFVINTPLELGELYGCETPIPQELSERYGGDRLNDTTLVAVRLVSGWGGREFGIESLLKSGDDLLVNVVQLDSAADGDDAMHYWTFFIEISKTDVKNVVINLTTVKPLEDNQSLVSIPHETLNNYLQYQTETDHSRYNGQAAINIYAAEEIARGLGDYSRYVAEIRYCPTNNYWLVRFTHRIDSGGHTVDYVIRAADGKVIAAHEDYLESPE